MARLIALGFALAGWACGTGEPATDDASGSTTSAVQTAGGCTVADRAPAGSQGDVPDAPVPLLVEQRMDSAEGPFVRRVAPDGSYWEYSASITTFEGGAIETTPVRPDWRRQPQRLDAGQVSRLTDVLQRQFFDLAAEYRPPGEVSDGFVVQWRACVDDRVHTVTLHAVDPGQIDGLAAVRDAFELALGEAAAAEADHSSGD